MKKLIALFILCAALTISVNAQSLSIQLSGTNVTCNGARNGSINLTVSGGTTPYTFLWSNGATTEDISALPPSYYSVRVTDAASNLVTNGITITEPAEINFQFTLSDYVVNSHHYNLSSYTWQNGSITTSVSGGVTPYSYLWSNNATTLSLTSLDAGGYKLVVTDASGCTKVSESLVLTKPDRMDWTMGGNANTNPSTQFIGTTDAQDVSFRANNQEALRIKAGGEILINKLADTISYSPVVVDSLGQLHKLNMNDEASSNMAGPWLLGGNPGVTDNDYVGTRNYKSLKFKTYANINGNLVRMIITPAGMVGIGTEIPTATFQVGNGMDKVTLGSIDPVSTNSYTVNYVGWNAGRKLNGMWEINTNTANNGGAVISTDVTGNMRFITIPNTGTTTQNLDDEAIVNKTKMIIKDNGNVGIGTTDPQWRDYFSSYNSNVTLHINGNDPVLRITDGLSGGADFEIMASQNAARLTSNNNIFMFLDADNNNSNESFRIYSNHDIGSGGTAEELFRVNQGGRAYAKSLKLTLDGFDDYVFNKDYNLRNLAEVEKFIQENHHLPEIPSECEVLEDGLDVGEMHRKLLKKVEELTLYLIAQDKKITNLEKTIEKLQSGVK